MPSPPTQNNTSFNTERYSASVPYCCCSSTVMTAQTLNIMHGLIVYIMLQLDTAEVWHKWHLWDKETAMHALCRICNSDLLFWQCMRCSLSTFKTGTQATIQLCISIMPTPLDLHFPNSYSTIFSLKPLYVFQRDLKKLTTAAPYTSRMIHICMCLIRHKHMQADCK